MTAQLLYNPLYPVFATFFAFLAPLCITIINWLQHSLFWIRYSNCFSLQFLFTLSNISYTPVFPSFPFVHGIPIYCLRVAGNFDDAKLILSKTWAIMTKSPCMQSILSHQEVLEQHYLACTAFLSHLLPPLNPILGFLFVFGRNFRFYCCEKLLRHSLICPPRWIWGFMPTKKTGHTAATTNKPLVGGSSL